MRGSNPRQPPIDWSRATYEGSTREGMHRWAELPLERILAAQQEMAELAEALEPCPLNEGNGSDNLRTKSRLSCFRPNHEVTVRRICESIVLGIRLQVSIFDAGAGVPRR